MFSDNGLDFFQLDSMNFLAVPSSCPCEVNFSEVNGIGSATDAVPISRPCEIPFCEVNKGDLQVPQLHLLCSPHMTSISPGSVFYLIS